MRWPIDETIRWMKEKKELEIIEEDPAQDQILAVRRRRLVVIIDKGQGLNARANTFV